MKAALRIAPGSVERIAPIISLSAIGSFLLGLLLIFSAPYKDGAFRELLIPLYGSYRISLVEAFTAAIVYAGIIVYGIRIRKHEQFIFASILLVVASRIFSLLSAEHMQPEQFLSLLRYVETLFAIYICCNLFEDQKNRRAFGKGVIVGVCIETVGSIGVFLWAGGQARGIFIGINSYMLQTVVIVACLLGAVNRRGRSWMSFYVAVMTLSILLSMTRSALVLLLMSLGVALFYVKWRIIKPLAFNLLMLIAGIVILEATPIFSAGAQNVTARIDAGLSGTGSVLYRLYLWDTAFGAFLEHPATGIGSGGFGRQQRNLPQVFNVSLSPEYDRDYELGAHNTMLGVLAETGLVGLAGYGLWVIAVVFMCSKLLRSRLEHLDPFAAAACVVVISLTLSDLWSQNSFTPISNILIGLVMGWQRQVGLR